MAPDFAFAIRLNAGLEMKELRILMLAESVSVHAQRWAKALASRGHGVTMLSFSREPVEGIRVVPFEVPRWSLRYPQRWFGRYRAFVRNVVRSVQPHLVHIHYLVPYAFRKDDLLRHALVISVWGTDVNTDVEEGAEAHARKVALLTEAEQITATTNFLAEECREYAGCPLGPIEVIPFGVETDLFAEASRKRSNGAGVLRVGFVKHLLPKYGPEYLIQAVPGIAAEFPNLEVLMVGDGPMREELLRLAGQLGVSDRITFLGDVPYTQIPDIHASLDVFVMPSVCREAFGVAAVEAQAAGVPVVASDFPGIREAVQDGVGGIIVPARDSDAIVEAVCGLLGDEERRKAMGLAGQKFVRERFTWSRNVDAMERVYERLLSETNGS